MSIRVRFAPSPTGYLHIGGARTAMYNYLLAKSMGGKYILRIEDTDLDRSERKFEESQIQDLKWLGITHDEGPDVGGEFGPYRQSERGEIYKAWGEKLIQEKKAYYCFCSEEELTAKKELAEAEKRPPHYDGKCRNLSEDEIGHELAQGKEPVIRFRAPFKSYVFNDGVRGRIVFPEGMVGDFVIIRANGVPVYNYAVVVDDISMKITHVIRGEEHLPNTLRQLMLYEAYQTTPPQFAHVSLLIGEDRQKLSKRHGATSVSLYREQNYLPSALLNYLCLLGWSHPDDKDVFNIHELGNLFNFNRFTKSAAIYDIQKLNYINGAHLHLLPIEVLWSESKKCLPSDSLLLGESVEYQLQVLNVFKNQMHFFSDLAHLSSILYEKSLPVADDSKEYSEFVEMKKLESTTKITQYLLHQIEELINKGQTFATEVQYNEWCEHIKKNEGVKGRPLFMGIRIALTLRNHGPELKFIIPLTKLSLLCDRIKLL